MLRKIVFWTLAGAAVAFFWFLYFTWLTWDAYHGGSGFTFSHMTEAVVDMTAPVRPLFGRHFAVTWYWSIALNAAIYACAGLAAEMIRLTVRWSAPRLRH